MVLHMNRMSTFIDSRELDERGPYHRERRRQLEVAGLFPPRIRLSARRNGWLRSELVIWERAKAAGFTDDQMRELIARMLEARAAAVELREVA
jgi:predicted DNA-binding transcriptional regulator AlpA